MRRATVSEALPPDLFASLNASNSSSKEKETPVEESSLSKTRKRASRILRALSFTSSQKKEADAAAAASGDNALAESESDALDASRGGHRGFNTIKVAMEIIVMSVRHLPVPANEGKRVYVSWRRSGKSSSGKTKKGAACDNKGEAMWFRDARAVLAPDADLSRSGSILNCTLYQNQRNQSVFEEKTVLFSVSVGSSVDSTSGTKKALGKALVNVALFRDHGVGAVHVIPVRTKADVELELSLYVLTHWEAVNGETFRGSGMPRLLKGKLTRESSAPELVTKMPPLSHSASSSVSESSLSSSGGTSAPASPPHLNLVFSSSNNSMGASLDSPAADPNLIATLPTVESRSRVRFEPNEAPAAVAWGTRQRSASAAPVMQPQDVLPPPRREPQHVLPPPSFQTSPSPPPPPPFPVAAPPRKHRGANDGAGDATRRKKDSSSAKHAKRVEPEHVVAGREAELAALESRLRSEQEQLASVRAELARSQQRHQAEMQLQRFIIDSILLFPLPSTVPPIPGAVPPSGGGGGGMWKQEIEAHAAKIRDLIAASPSDPSAPSTEHVVYEAIVAACRPERSNMSLNCFWLAVTDRLILSLRSTPGSQSTRLVGRVSTAGLSSSSSSSSSSTATTAESRLLQLRSRIFESLGACISRVRA